MGVAAVRRARRLGADAILTARRTRILWWSAFVALGAAAVARNVLALSTVPPGLYVDESSIGYNAWAIAHYGVDEHGTPFPLYFEAFGEYKNPIYIYALVPLTRLFGLSSAVERFPAAVFGAAALLFITLTAWRITRSLPITVFVLALGALTPWLVQESRVGFEVVSMLATLSVAVWCLADPPTTTPARFAVAGLFFALSIFAYSTARLEILLFGIAFAVAYGRSRAPGWWRTLVVIIAGYGVLGVWALMHPGALTAEFNVVSIAADGAPLGTLIARFVTNYIGYFGPHFLFIDGDPYLRHNTGYAGMLPAIAAPLLLLGLWALWRRRAEPFARFTLFCILLAPVAASLTMYVGAPHALRGSVMLPFLFVVMIYGLDAARGLLSRHRWVAALGATALALQGGLFMLDMYTAYPVRAATWFDDGVPAAVVAATHAAKGHAVYLSTTIEEPYIQAFFALLPPPPTQPVQDDATPGLTELGMAQLDPIAAEQAARPGDILVLAPDDPRPLPPSQLIDTEFGPADPLSSTPSQPLVYVYRFETAAA
ncbi:MAG: hypothetical protein JOY80_11235 [Candidatus Dormibacteraeota bacterium]|nr:hypothetical protein [Candidatus Dormibacteraeota bacterium]